METPLKIRCPHCDQPSENIKRASTWFLLFIVFGYYWRKTTVTGCRECVRQQIVSNALINIITANVFWPIIILPVSIYQYYSIREDGHDQNVLAEAMRISQISYHSKLGKL